MKIWRIIFRCETLKPCNGRYLGMGIETALLLTPITVCTSYGKISFDLRIFVFTRLFSRKQQLHKLISYYMDILDKILKKG
jgi:hypothetical protein